MQAAARLDRLGSRRARGSRVISLRPGLAERGQPVPQPGRLGRGQAGIRASVAAAAVCSWTVARPEQPFQRPGGDVDELHPSIGDD